MTSTLSTNPSLLARACDGDEVAWQQLSRLYAPLVYEWARRGGLQASDAADVVQETFLVLTKRLMQFDPSHEGNTFRGWLWTIARNKAADLLRTRQRHPQAPGGDTAHEQFAKIAAAEEPSAFTSNEPPGDPKLDRIAVLHRALALLRQRFDESTWKAFWRTTVDGCTPEAVAAELGLSRWTVYKARARVLQRLRSEIAELEM